MLTDFVDYLHSVTADPIRCHSAAPQQVVCESVLWRNSTTSSVSESVQCHVFLSEICRPFLTRGYSLRVDIFSFSS